MPSESPTPESEDNGLDLRWLVGIGILIFLAGAITGSMLYAFGIAHQQFDMSLLRGGLMTFGVVTLMVVTGVVVMTLLIQVLAILWPRSLTVWSEYRILKKARNRTLSLLQRRHRMQEEKARLTARLQATYLLERESARLANQKAMQELRSALQISAVKSCEIVMEHLNRSLEEYEALIEEIDSSSLSAEERRELHAQLQAKLSFEGTEHKRRSAQQMMEDAIWDVRLSKARRLAQSSKSSAQRYLETLRQKTDSHRILLRLDALLKELRAESAT